MTEFNDLYNHLVKATVNDNKKSELEKIRTEDYNNHQLDCLLNPKNYASVWSIGDCTCSSDREANCSKVCLFDAIKKDDNGNKQESLEVHSKN